jgi:hypothetical protein
VSAPYFPIEAGPHRLTMGLTQLRDQPWFEIGHDVTADLTEKDRLLAHHHDKVVATVPSSHDGQREVLDLIAGHVTEHHPDLYRRDGDTIHITGLEPPRNLRDPDRLPLETAARLVQEDLCLMEPDGEHSILTAAVVCFPTRWSLTEKIGRPLGPIHAPVPGYEAELDHSMEAYFQRIRPGKPTWRINWSLVEDPALYLPRRRQPIEEPITADTAGQRLWLRCERQTLARMPKTGGVLFTIRIHRTRLSEAITPAGHAERMLDAIEAMPEPMRRYKGIDRHYAALVGYLDRRVVTY